MNQAELIRSLRLEQGLTQRELAEVLHVTDKAVSKWERGLGQPDASLLGPLAKALHVEPEALLEGTLSKNARSSGNLNRLKVFVCPCCGNVVTAEAPARVSCCGRGLKALVPREAAEGERLSLIPMDGGLFLSTEHPMTREHHIAFVMLLDESGLLLRRLYPEWPAQLNLPFTRRGRLLWYCTQHGLFCQKIRL